MEKYFIQNDTTGYLVKIFDKNFNGTPTEIFGKIAFDKGSVNNILDTVRGTGLNLQLEASELLTFDEFSNADEKTYTVKITKGSSIVYNGFLKPDGVVQSFVRDLWIVSLDFIDGLGTLKDLSFVDSAGIPYYGKQSLYTIINSCLQRTGLQMTINSFVDVYYIGYAGSNILKDTYVFADRFVKDDAQVANDEDATYMDCDEVLNSVLNIVSACITQQEGQWWIYRPNELIDSVSFIDNTSDTTFLKNLYLKVGSQVDNYYPHHCNGNQQIMTKGAVSAYRLSYKYGFKKEGNLNPNLAHDAALIYPNWTITSNLQGNIIVNDPLDTEGLIVKVFPVTNLPITDPQPPMRIDLFTSDAYNVLSTSQIDVNIRFNTKNGATNRSTFFYFKIKRTDGKYANVNGEWVDNVEIHEVPVAPNLTFDWQLKCQQVDVDCGIIIVFQSPKIKTLNFPEYNNEIVSCNIVNNYNYDGKIGEFHTVQRNNAPSSIVKNNQEVFNGDSIGSIFEGAIFKADKTTITSVWTRKGKFEEKPILRISAEDDMRISQSPAKEFSGDFYGLVPYLSIVEINNVVGKFMFIEYSYDTDRNVTSGKLLQFFTNEVLDLNYKLTFDYGKTVKPTIIG